MGMFKTTVNSSVDLLSAFASEATRVASEVGTRGILGGQARVEGVQSTWAYLTLNVNVSFLPSALSMRARQVVRAQSKAKELEGQIDQEKGRHNPQWNSR